MTFWRFTLFAGIFIVLLSLSYYAYSFKRAGQAAKAPNAEKQIAFLGDSLVEGVGATNRDKTFAELVFAEIKQTNPDASMHNFATAGARVQDVVDVQLPQLHELNPTTVIIIVGANDVLLQTPAEDFAKSYALLLQTVVKDKRRVIISTIPKLAETPVVPDALKPAADTNTQEFNRIIKNAAQQYPSVKLFDLYAFSELEFTKNQDLLSVDKFHPNDEGYQKMSEAIIKVM